MSLRVKKGLLWLFIGLLYFGSVGYFILYRQFLFPKEMEIAWESTRYHAIEVYSNSFKTLGTPKQQNILQYNKDKEKETKLIEKITGVFSFEVGQVEALNKYGQVYVGSNGEKKMVNSQLSEGESIKVTVPDYDKILPNKSEIDNIKDFDSLDELYGTKLEGVFVSYLLGLNEIPTKVVEIIPEFQQTENGFILNDKTSDEIINYFYENESFDNLMKRFAEVSIYGEPNPDINYWKEKLQGLEGIKPDETISKDTIRAEWLYWNSLSNKNEVKEPTKSLTYFYMNPKFLVNIAESSGNGSFDFKASFEVPVRTYFEDKDGNKLPVQITLKQSYVGVEAIQFLEKLDTRNRGLQASSKLKFYVVVYELENISTNGVISTDGVEGFAMSDNQGNLSARTGRMFGLNELSSEGYSLKAGEKDELVYWTAIPDLGSKELAWGTTFSNKNDIVWFNKVSSQEEMNKLNEYIKEDTITQESVTESSESSESEKEVSE